MAQKAMFAKNLSLMLKSGLDILEALEVVRELATGRLEPVIGDIIGSIDAGNSLSSALGKHPKIFSGFFVNTVQAGEMSGTLVENLENLAAYFIKTDELFAKIKSASVYPLIVMVGALLLGVILSFAVLPKIIPLFEGMNVELPITTRLLIYFTHFIERHRDGLLSGLFGGSIFMFWVCTRQFAKPVTHWIILKIPVVNKLVANSSLANFSSTLSMMLKSGLIIDEALLVARDVVGNHYFKKALSDVHQRTMQGKQLSESLSAHPEIFPKMVVSMVMIGERSGNLDSSLSHLSSYYEGEVDAATKNLSVAIEPLMLLFIGLLVGMLAVSIITPIYKLTGNVGKR